MDPVEVAAANSAVLQNFALIGQFISGNIKLFFSFLGLSGVIGVLALLIIAFFAAVRVYIK